MDYGIAKKNKFFVIFKISCAVPLDFFDPVSWVISFFKAKLKIIPVLSMEKFAVTKDCYFIFGKHDIR